MNQNDSQKVKIENFQDSEYFSRFALFVNRREEPDFGVLDFCLDLLGLVGFLLFYIICKKWKLCRSEFRLNYLHAFQSGMQHIKLITNAIHSCMNNKITKHSMSNCNLSWDKVLIIFSQVSKYTIFRCKHWDTEYCSCYNNLSCLSNHIH